MAKKDAATLTGALKSIEERFGKGSIMNLDDSSIDRNVKVIPTGILPLDVALGVGGVPRGRIVEIYGPESSGKTTVAMHVVAEAQKMGLRCAYIDSEHAFDPAYAESLGLDTENLLFAQPDNAEEALEIADTLVQTGEVGVIVFDSVAAMVPRAEVEGEFGEAHVGLQARLMSQALRKLTGAANRNDTLLIFINQIRYKVGVIYGSPETTPGGNALKFYASVRMDVRRKETNKDKSGDSVSNRVNVKIVKNKVAPPFKIAEFNIVFGKGADKMGSLVGVATDLGVIVRSGAWYSFEGEQIGQGSANAAQYLEDNPAVMKAVLESVRNILENGGNNG
jgi:recombination protein RecA